MFVRTFESFKPPERHDGQPFTKLRIEESADRETWTEIETIDFSGDVDANPAKPRARSFTTTHATLARGWYRIVWEDATAAKFITDPVFYPRFVGGLSLEELKERMGHREGDKDNQRLNAFLAAAIEQAQQPPPFGCGRLLVPDPPLSEDDPVTRTFKVNGGRVRIPDAREIVAVVCDDEPITDYTTFSLHGHVVAISLPRPKPVSVYDSRTWLASGGEPAEVQVTGRFGFVELPPDLKEAIYTLAARAFYEQGALLRDEVVMTENGPIGAYYRQLPARTKLAFTSYAVNPNVGTALP